MTPEQRKIINKGFGTIAHLAIRGQKSVTEDATHLAALAHEAELTARALRETLEALVRA